MDNGTSKNVPFIRWLGQRYAQILVHTGNILQILRAALLRLQ